MHTINSEIKTQFKQAAFEIRFIWWALGLAIFAGFAIGAHVASVIGLDLPSGKGFYSYIQTHGHLQLIGWAGLFIIGISLHFIPRLAGIPILNPRRIERILWLIVTGLILRFIAHAVLPYLTHSRWFLPVNLILTASGVIEFSGILVYLATILQTIQAVKDSTRRPALQSVKAFFILMLPGWFSYASLNLFLLLDMLLNKNVVLHQAWNEFAIQLFIGTVLLPVAFVFSVRMFPLYLRLPAIDWSVQRVAVAYLISVCLQLLPTLPPILKFNSPYPLFISNLGQIFKSGVILWFVWKLDLLTRQRAPWTVHRLFQPKSDRRPTREGLPDYGEFGRFERLIYAAYIWLICGAIAEMIVGVSFIFGWSFSISNDAVRHLYLLGFITHLILGMSVRMIPGFIKKKAVASPRLVNATFWFGTFALVSRVTPLLVPVNFLQAIPGSLFLLQIAFAFSGIFGLVAVSCLAINLIKTTNPQYS